MKRNGLAGWILILFGALLLLAQFDWFSLNRFVIALIITLFLSALFLNKGLSHPLKKGILSGSFFLLVSLQLILMRLGVFPINDTVGFGLMAINLGLANFIYFMATRNRIGNIFAGLIFILLGLPPLAGYYQYIPYMDLEYYYSTYWPLLLIIIGLGLLIDGYVKRLRKTVQS